MTYQEAIEFFAAFGNVSRDPDKLRTQQPTEGQLNDAVQWAVNVKGQSRERAETAKRVILLPHWKRPAPATTPAGDDSSTTNQE